MEPAQQGWSVSSRSAKMLGRSLGMFAIYLITDESGEHLIYSYIQGLVWLGSQQKFCVVNHVGDDDKVVS